MSYRISDVEVWAGDVRNQPGMLARILEALANAGTQLQFLIARRVTGNTSRVFVAPIADDVQRRAAYDVGLLRTRSMYAFRIEGPDQPGLAAELTRAIADQNLNLRGVSSSVIVDRFVMYLAFESHDDAQRAADALSPKLRELDETAPKPLAPTIAPARPSSSRPRPAAAAPVPANSNRPTRSAARKSAARPAATPAKGKATKKSAPKAARAATRKKSAKKSAKKPTARKSISRGGTKKAAGRPAKKAARKTAKKPAKKPAAKTKSRGAKKAATRRGRR